MALIIRTYLGKTRKLFDSPLSPLDVLSPILVHHHCRVSHFFCPGGTSISGGRRGLDLTSGLEAKFGARFVKVHQIKGKLGKFCYHKTQKLGRIPILGSYLKLKRQNLEYLSPIFLKAKFGAPTRISEGNFGAKPPDLPV